MQRRTWLQWAGATAAAAGCGGGSEGGLPPSPPPAARPPNVLMIAIDDLNDWVGFLGGHPQVQTPGMDALAARATVFPRAYCTAPVCSASRAGILSGLLPSGTGVYENETTFRAANPGKPLVMDLFRQAGYRVEEAGKIDHQFALGTQPLPSPMPYANKRCPAPLGVGAFDWGPAPGPDVDQPDHRFAQYGIDFLARQPTTEPFFLSIGFVRTHVGWYVPQRFFDLYPKASTWLPPVPADDLDDVGLTGRAVANQWNFHNCITTQGLWADAVQAYLASISWVDSQIARLVAALDASAHAANTLVVLWSDHGFHLGEKFHWHKQALWERSTRVPFLVRVPGQSAARRVEACVSLADLAPTLLDYGGVAPAYAMDGVSLRPVITDPGLPWDRPVLTTLKTLGQLHHAVRTRDWRCIRYQSGERELYDPRADPGELTNLAGRPELASVIQQLEAHMPPL